MLPQLVERLFGLMTDIGNDEVVQTLDNLIEKFGESMAPYAVKVGLQTVTPTARCYLIPLPTVTPSRWARRCTCNHTQHYTYRSYHYTWCCIPLHTVA